MPPSLTPEQRARAQDLMQNLVEMTSQLSNRGGFKGSSPLFQLYMPFIVALRNSLYQLTHLKEESSGLGSQQEKRWELILTCIAWMKSVFEVVSQDLVQENETSSFECLIETFVACGRFWEDSQHAGSAEEKVQNYVIENYEHAMAVAEHIKPTDTGQRLISETYMKYWRVLERRWQRTRRREDLDAAVQVLRRSGEFMQSDEATKTCQVTLANLLWMRWRSTPQYDALFEEAMDSSREVVRATFWNQAGTGECLDRCATMHKNLLEASQIYDGWFTEREIFSDLDAAVKAAALAYQSLWPGAPRSVQETAMRRFGDMSRIRYDWAGCLDDLRQALIAARSVLAKFPCKPGDVDFNWTRCAMRLVQISSYCDLEDCLDEAQSLLNRSLKYYEGIVENPTQWVPCERAVCLRFISNLYQMMWQRRFMNRGTRKTLDLAVECADKAVDMLHGKDPLLCDSVDNRTLAYYARYVSPYAEASDLNTAIVSASRGVNLGEHNYSNIRRPVQAAERMTVLSIAIAGEILTARYLRDGHLSDLDAAIHAVEMQLKLFPPMHPRRSHALQNYRDRLDLKLKSYLKGRDGRREDNLLRRWLFKISRSSDSRFNSLAETDMNLLRDLIARGTGRLEHSPLDAIRRPQMSATVLGNEPIYKDFSPIRYARGSYPTDLQLSMDKPGLCTQGSARSLLDGGHSGVDEILTDIRLSDVLKEKMTDWRRPSMTDLDSIEKLDRFMSIGELMFEHRQWKGLHAIWRYCFGSLDSLNLHTMRAKEYQIAFRRLAVLAVMVASSMLAQGQEIWSIILVLERGREVLNSHSFLSTRTQRIKYDPHLKRQVEELVADLNNPGPERNHEWRRSQFRHLGAFECNSRDLLKAVRDLITCETDIAPFGKEHIIKQSQAGPIVMLVATTVAAHAIIITPFNTYAIALDKCNYQDALQKSRIARLALEQCEQDQGLVGDANQELRQLLKWLWDTVVHPIVKRLELLPQTSVEKLPRIQWVCCGIFSRLPIHAAGIFTRPGKPHLAQYAVSSYLSSVRYTIMAKRKHPYLRPTQSKILIISMPHTEANAAAGYGDLDTAAESLAISRNLSRSLGTTYLTNPDMGSVESLIGGCRIAHFSCHGVIDPADPLRSRLVIRFDAQRALTVAAIRNLSSSFSRLAFLSACHSASFEDQSTADEVIHVAKAFQLAGFPSVVGTLWQAFDRDAAAVSGEFYAYIKRRLDSGAANDDLDGDLFARALHVAVGLLREKNPYSCIGWASWIHYGD